MPPVCVVFFFFFNDTATTEIYTLSLHDALPILNPMVARHGGRVELIDVQDAVVMVRMAGGGDRKSTRLNSSHSQISYAVFCLKKKKTTKTSASQDDRQTLHPTAPRQHDTRPLVV